MFYSPDYTVETGNVWTLEGSFSQVLPTIFGRVTPTFSALLGYQKGDDKAPTRAQSRMATDNYVYWNAGVNFGLDKNWSLDVRYWDTNIADAGGFCTKVRPVSVRRAGGRYPQVHVLIVHELSEMRRAPFGARLLFGVR